ncbi:MAG: hypothetical protein PHT41_05670, partial [Candidatus Omnitrophica bacterium]|nr:hypothetical protein [Candidatus Omnitrophota bacterium]
MRDTALLKLKGILDNPDYKAILGEGFIHNARMMEAMLNGQGPFADRPADVKAMVLQGFNRSLREDSGWDVRYLMRLVMLYEAKMTKVEESRIGNTTVQIKQAFQAGDYEKAEQLLQDLHYENFGRWIFYHVYPQARYGEAQVLENWGATESAEKMVELIKSNPRGIRTFAYKLPAWIEETRKGWAEFYKEKDDLIKGGWRDKEGGYGEAVSWTLASFMRNPIRTIAATADPERYTFAVDGIEGYGATPGIILGYIPSLLGSTYKSLVLGIYYPTLKGYGIEDARDEVEGVVTGRFDPQNWAIQQDSYAWKALGFTGKASKTFLEIYGGARLTGIPVTSGTGFWNMAPQFRSLLFWSELNVLGGNAAAQYKYGKPFSAEEDSAISVSFLVPGAIAQKAQAFGQAHNLITVTNKGAKIAEGLTGFQKAGGLAISSLARAPYGWLTFGHMSSTLSTGKPLTIGESLALSTVGYVSRLLPGGNAKYPMGTSASRIAGLSGLAASTVTAAFEMNNPLYQKIGATSGLTGILLKPGRTIIATTGNVLNWFGHGNKWAEGIDTINYNELKKFNDYMHNVSPILGTVPAFLVSFGRAFTDTYTGAILIRTALNPADTINGILEFAKTAKQLGEGQLVNARPVEVASLAGSLFGARAGLRGMWGRVPGLAGNLRLVDNLEKATRLQRMAGFLSGVANEAGSYRTLFGLAMFNIGLPAIMNNDLSFDALSKSIGTNAYKTDQLLMGATGISFIFRGVGSIGNRLSRIPAVKSFMTETPVADGKGKIGSLSETAAFAGKHSGSIGLAGVGAGAGMYLLGTETGLRQNTIGDILANAGLVIAGAGGLMALRGFSTHTNWGKNVAAYREKVELARKNPGDHTMPEGLEKWEGRISSLGYNAVAGPLSILSYGSLVYGLKKGIFDPGVTAFSVYLNPPEGSSGLWAAARHIWNNYSKDAYPHLFRDGAAPERDEKNNLVFGKDGLVQYKSGALPGDWANALFWGAVTAATAKIIRVAKNAYVRLPESQIKGWDVGLREGASDVYNTRIRSSLIHRISEKIAGKPGAFIGDLAQGTMLTLGNSAYTLFFVIAPLQGVLEWTSFLTQRHVMPSAYTHLEKSLLGFTFGAFWQDKDVYDDGKLVSPSNWRKYEGAKTVWDYAKRSYLTGLFGVNEDGSAKVKSFSEFPYWPGQFWQKLDKSSAFFAVTLAVLQPFAEPVLGNIRAGNFGKSFQAAGEGIKATLGIDLKPSSNNLGWRELLFSKQGIIESAKGFVNWITNMSIKGTIEEINEQFIQIGLALTPISFIAPVAEGLGFSPLVARDLYQQAQEIAQELTSPDGGAGIYSNGKSFWQALCGGARITGIKTSGDTTADISDLTGKTRDGLRQDPTLLGKLAGLPKDAQITVEMGGATRVFDVTDVKDWSHTFNVQAKRFELANKLQQPATARQAIETVLTAVQGQDRVEAEAARYVLTEQLTAQQIAKLLHSQQLGSFSAGTVTFGSGGKAFSLFLGSLNTQIVERLAFEQGFADSVISAYESIDQ